MDHRNLSEKEKVEIEKTKAATLAMKSMQRREKADVIRHTTENDEMNEQGMTQKEMKIVR